MENPELELCQKQGLLQPKKKTKKQQRFRQTLAGYLFIAPNFLGFFVFALAPIIATIALSFSDWDLVNPLKWVGWLNYKNIFASPSSWDSLKQTILFTVLNVPIQCFIALGIALILNQKLKGLNLFRTLFLLPWVCMPIAHALVWQWIYNYSFGILNHIITSFGFQGVRWLNNPTVAFFAVMFVNIWSYLGMHIVLLLAALQNVPGELYEAALVDGASAWVRFWKITFPMISPVFFYDVVINMIGTLQIFDLPFALTNGGPGNVNLYFNLLLYRKAFSYFQMGEACAMGVILFVLIALLTFITFKYIGSRVNYDQV
ncbi:MAG: carbohydrate ABC transporter permease [Bacteroidota bacterium]